MTQVTYFKQDTGQIVGSASGLIEDLELNTPNQCAMLSGMYNAEDYYVDVNNNTVVAMPPRPSTYHVFDYTNKTWVDARTIEDQKIIVKSLRNRYLDESDWTQLPDVQLSTKSEWAIYRQELRDVTSQSGYPLNVIWPTPPQG